MGTLYSAILHTHELLITLYVIIFAIKLFFLLANKNSRLENFRAKTRVVGEMVLPTLFLASGIALAIISKTGFSDTWFLIKICLIAVAVVTGILTFRKNSKILGIITLLIFLYIIMLSYIKDPALKKHGQAPEVNSENVIKDPNAPGYDAVKFGQVLYKSNGCNTCHGYDGTLGNHGAANLATSTIDSPTIINTIRDGKGGIMVAYGKVLNPIEIHALAEYVKSLRTPKP